MGRQSLVALEDEISYQVVVEVDIEDSKGSSIWTESVFEKIFLQNYSRVLTVILRLVGDRGQAEELTNDVFWRLYRRPLLLGKDHNLAGWLYRTATYLGIDFLRASARRRHYEQIAGIKLLEANNLTDPFIEMSRSEKCERVRAALARLKPPQARILILRSSGLSYKELAEALGVKLSSIGTLLARAEAEFEKHYFEMHGEME